MATVLAWIVPLMLFCALWFAFMRYVGAPITWSSILAIASIFVLVVAVQQRLWWLAAPAAVLLVLSGALRRRDAA